MQLRMARKSRASASLQSLPIVAPDPRSWLCCPQNEEDAYRKIRLRVEDVQGKNCLTNFWVSRALSNAGSPGSAAHRQASTGCRRRDHTASAAGIGSYATQHNSGHGSSHGSSALNANACVCA